MIKAFIIIMKGYRHSENVGADCIRQAKRVGMDVERFNAVIGKEGIKYIKKFRLKYAQLEEKKNRMKREGKIGCFMSHYLLWLKCFEMNESILILEHDGFLLGNINEVECEFEDVLHLDSSDPYSPEYNPDIYRKKKHQVIDYLNLSHCMEDNWGRYFRGGYAYVIKPHAAAKIINGVKKIGIRTNDHCINTKFVRLQAVSPSMARLHPYYNADNIKANSYSCRFEAMANRDASSL